MSRYTDVRGMTTADVEEWDRTLRRALRRMTAMKIWLDDELAIAVNHQTQIETHIATINPTGRALALWNYHLHQAQTLVGMATRERAALDTSSVRTTINLREVMVEYLAEELDRRRRNAAANLPNH